jgi:hypothetical protein
MARFGLKVRPTTNCRSRAGVFCDETAGGVEPLTSSLRTNGPAGRVNRADLARFLASGRRRFLQTSTSSVC